MKVDRPPLWEPEEEAYLRLLLGRRLPEKELWADRGRAVEEGERVHKQRYHLHHG